MPAQHRHKLPLQYHTHATSQGLPPVALTVTLSTQEWASVDPCLGSTPFFFLSSLLLSPFHFLPVGNYCFTPTRSTQDTTPVGVSHRLAPPPTLGYNFTYFFFYLICFMIIHTSQHSQLRSRFVTSALLHPPSRLCQHRWSRCYTDYKNYSITWSPPSKP